MSLSRRIAAALDDTTAPRVVAVEEGPHRLSLSARVVSPVGVEAEALEFAATDTGRPERSLDDLKAWADRLSARVTYLMEPLVVLEADSLGVEVGLRSERPTARDGRRSYYEARLDRRGTLSLRRVTFDESDRRRADATFQLTREVLERLADDLAATAG